jgi:hypothetical protein
MKQDQTDRLIEALERIVHGRMAGESSYPTGFEALVMAIGGHGFPGTDSIAAGLHHIAESVSELADAVREAGQ